MTQTNTPQSFLAFITTFSNLFGAEFSQEKLMDWFVVLGGLDHSFLKHTVQSMVMTHKGSFAPKINEVTDEYNRLRRAAARAKTQSHIALLDKQASERGICFLCDDSGMVDYFKDIPQ